MRLTAPGTSAGKFKEWLKQLNILDVRVSKAATIEFRYREEKVPVFASDFAGAAVAAC
jgi:hypothetical protein